MTEEVYPLPELIQICQRILHTGLMGYQMTRPMARTIIGLVQAVRELRSANEDFVDSVDEMKKGLASVENPPQQVEVILQSLTAFLSSIPPEEMARIKSVVGVRKEQYARRSQKEHGVAQERSEGRGGGEEKPQLHRVSPSEHDHCSGEEAQGGDGGGRPSPSDQ